MGVKGRRKRREEREKRRMRERGRVERVMGRRRRGGWNVVQTENAVHAVLYLVRVFVNGSVRMRRREMEYRGRIFVVVYVGAIAVLFRFVVMMLNGTGMEERKGEKEEGVGRRRRRRRGRGGGKVREEEGNQRWREKVEWVKRRDKRGNMEGLGQVRYTVGREYVVRAGRVLLVGMVGAIVLTLQVGTRRKKVEGKRQHVSEQRSREEEEAVRRVDGKERK